MEQGREKIRVRQSRPLPESPKNDAITRSVRDNFISPLIADFKLEACNADSTSVIIQINDIYDGSETSINNVFDNINLGTSAVKDLSRIMSIKAFPNNIVATSELTTKVREGMSAVNVTVEVSSSLVLLPEKPMMYRLTIRKWDISQRTCSISAIPNRKQKRKIHYALATGTQAGKP